MVQITQKIGRQGQNERFQPMIFDQPKAGDTRMIPQPLVVLNPTPDRAGRLSLPKQLPFAESLIVFELRDPTGRPFLVRSGQHGRPNNYVRGAHGGESAPYAETIREAGPDLQVAIWLATDEKTEAATLVRQLAAEHGLTYRTPPGTAKLRANERALSTSVKAIAVSLAAAAQRLTILEILDPAARWFRASKAERLGCDFDTSLSVPIDLAAAGVSSRISRVAHDGWRFEVDVGTRWLRGEGTTWCGAIADLHLTLTNHVERRRP